LEEKGALKKGFTDIGERNIWQEGYLGRLFWGKAGLSILRKAGTEKKIDEKKGDHNRRKKRMDLRDETRGIKFICTRKDEVPLTNWGGLGIHASKERESLPPEEKRKKCHLTGAKVR